jgi:hypothetical protein
MWMVDPKLMCDQHLIGEHVELHMLVGTIKNNKSIKGYLNGLVEPNLIIQRHSQLVNEMTWRKMKHKTPIETNIPVIISHAVKPILEQENIKALAQRCKQCATLIKKDLQYC